MKRRSSLLALVSGAVLAAASFGAAAQAYPSKPITMVVPFPPAYRG